MHLNQSDLHFFPFLKGKVEERGRGAGEGFTLNLPLPEGAGDVEAWQLLEEFAFPALQAFSPEVLFLALGFDGLEGDPCLAGLCLSSSFLQRVVRRCCHLCQRVVCTLQGGYQPEATAEALSSVLDVLAEEGHPCDEANDHSDPGCPQSFQEYIAGIKAVLADKTTWWSVEQSFEYVPEGMHRPREDSEHSETSARQSGKRFHVHILSCSIGLASEGTFGRLMKTGPVRVRVRRSGYRTACHLFQSPLLGSALKGKLGAGLGATCYIGTYFG
ncbi:unnamed protein product [Durusdinium trenchii]|uniref:Histone deacetylase domain-containing protein n=1 Tax=Durusdinium trenchii TaxID=1381693 RepID=A0ABP0PI44_9DINO